MLHKITKVTHRGLAKKHQIVGARYMVRLKAGEAKTTPIGVFESTMPTPKIFVTSRPDIGDRLGVSFIRVDEASDYTVTCCVQNFSDESCDVTIRSAE